MKTQLIILNFTLLVATYGCGLGSEPAGTATGEDALEAELETPSGAVDIPATVRKNLGITFARVERRDIAKTLRLPGSFELEPRAREEYSMSLAGRVELLVDELEAVSVGQPLFRYQSPEWLEISHEIISAEQKIEEVSAQIVVLKAKLTEAGERHERGKKRLGSLRFAEFRDADLESEVADLAAALPMLRAELSLSETLLANAHVSHEHALHHASTITGFSEEELESEIEVDGRHLHTFQSIDWIDVLARRPGIVESLAISPGAYVEGAEPVLSTVDIERVRFRATIPQGSWMRFSEASTARIVPPRAPGVPISEGVEAKLQVGLDAHPNERTLTIYAKPAKALAWTRPGISAFLELVIDKSDGLVLAIPRSAVVRDGLAHVFFRRNPSNPDQALRIVADMGANDGRWVEVSSGVGPGDEVVLDGVYELKLATSTNSANQKGGHFHADGTFHSEE
ncbi:MAG: multidrug efflux pump subunit AcrA (membrane-fusion protein) [Planctomycetota bacterium]|jgi:multidrug efflux pump subunit AcrA (membrane-fusion protein)